MPDDRDDTKASRSSTSPRVLVQYHLQRHGQDTSILAGSVVLSRESMCPPFESCPNRNLFQQFYGIELHHNDHTYVCALSTYEFSRCFGLIEDIQYRLSHERYKFGLNAAMPGWTLSWIFDQVHTHLVYLRDANSEIFSPNQFAAPAPQFKLSSMARFAHVFPHGSNGHKHMPTTRNCA